METYRLRISQSQTAIVDLIEQTDLQTVINVTISPSLSNDSAMLMGDSLLDLVGDEIFLPNNGKKWWLIPVNLTDPPVLFAAGCTFKCGCDGNVDPNKGGEACLVNKAIFSNRVEFYCAAGSCMDCCLGKMVCPPQAAIDGSFLAYGTDVLILNGVIYS